MNSEQFKNIIFDPNSLTDIHHMGFQTNMGFNNCFSVFLDDMEIKIVNFYAENFDLLRKNKIIEIPFKILKIYPSVGLIMDERIPTAFYRDKWCETCCPFEFLPIPQKFKRWQQQLVGNMVIKDLGDGRLMDHNPKQKSTADEIAEQLNLQSLER